MTNFGASFKKARESKGISLDQIANQTRISTRFLGAIENEDFQTLPGGIFNRGFVRAFAEAVGLDPDQAVADYDRLTSVREANDIVASENVQPPKTERNLYPIAIGILAAAIAIFYLVTRGAGGMAELPPQPAATIPALQPTPSAPAVDKTPATPPAAATEPEPVPLAARQMLTLDIEARERTWIKVTSDGNSNPGEILEPGMMRKFTAENSINISIGNAAGLRLKVNDMPLRPLGKSGQVRSLTITPANFKDFVG